MAMPAALARLACAQLPHGLLARDLVLALHRRVGGLLLAPHGAHHHRRAVRLLPAASVLLLALGFASDAHADANSQIELP